MCENIKIGDLLKSEKAKVILEKHIPGFTTSPMVGMIKGYTFSMLAAIPQANFSSELVEAIYNDLSKIQEEFNELDISNICEFKEVMIPMRDGIKLLTRICMPRSLNSEVPTLFTRTPYNNFETSGRDQCIEHAKQGYATFYQQCRGTYGSEGQWVPNENERQDGLDSINWLAEQEWCKSIGIFGESYQALAGWIFAHSLPEKVKSLYLVHYSVDRYLSAYKQGLFRHDVLTGWAMGNAGKEIDSEYIESALYRPHIKVDEDLWGIKLDWYKKWITSTDYDCDYWHTGVWGILREMPKKVNIPVCIVAGWYDHHLEGSLLAYETLLDEIKNKSRLLIGGWNHGKISSVPAHNPKKSVIDFELDMIKWFNKVLIEESDPDAGVEVYSIGDDTWHKLDSWPIDKYAKKSIYLSSNKRNDCTAFKIEEEEIKAITSIEYIYNPEDPVYTDGSESMLTSFDKIGSKLQQEPGYRDDVVSFITDTLAEDIHIGGKMNVKLYVSSDCEDTCFTAKVMEVLPNGDAYNIRSTVSTLAYRNNSRTRLEYNPGEVVEINIDLLPVVWNIKIGSRIRVDISSSSFPEYSIHSNYPGIWSLQESTRLANQKLYMGGEYSAKLEIPIIDL